MPAKVPISKVGVLALLISVAVAASFAAMHFLHSKKLATERDQIQEQLVAQTSKNQTQVAQLFKQQADTLTANIDAKIQEKTAPLEQQIVQSEARIGQLEQQIGRIQQNKSLDWLVHEAQYLLRIASRTLWLEKNTSTAINLLKDADNRLKTLNDPQLITVRQAIRNDIETLQVLPVVDNESLLLSLSALGQQVNKLPLAMVKIPESEEAKESLTLSEDASDWKENLAKTWRKFLADFITVSRRKGSVEPLMSPQHQQNLRENIMLKLQVAQWAVTKRQTHVFQQALTDIAAWLNEYFDMSQLSTQHFSQSIGELKAQAIDADYPKSLTALNEIRDLLVEKPLAPLPNIVKSSEDTIEVKVNDNSVDDLGNNEAETNKSESN